MFGHSLKVGLSFGMMSGVITTLGLMVGLSAGTQSTQTVLGGIIIIAVADAFSDALGIHISEEAENVHTPAEIWTSTLSAFLSKFLFSAIFIFPLLWLPLNHAVFVSIVFGLSLIIGVSYFLARQQGIPPWRVIAEHVLVCSVVIILTHWIGVWVSHNFH